ncbi:MAG: hypothetical protein IJJ26_13005 [Victivallales bacterium]|nr:hypothetical protein [Victivallales bacterium]
MALEQFRKLAPFMRRANAVVTGRGKLAQLRHLAFVIVTTDISENSRDQALRDYACPVYQCLTSAEIQELFGLENTKLLGFPASALANSVKEELAPFLLKHELHLQTQTNRKAKR